MEFWKMVTMTLYARQQKRHRYKEQTVGLCGRRQGWDDMKEKHWNMYITICEIDCQSKFNAWNMALKASALGQPWGMGWGGRREGVQDGDTCTPMFITALFTIARTWKKPRCPLADEWIRKLWYIYTMEYYSAIKKHAFESVLMRWMNLEPIIQSEVSEKEKHQYSILTHIYGI